ncbi:hypothetical protein [Deinococcus marmoris]|uniref:Uncharacterized protein n=1 Tax=Deinococcus marmoris TaxID=249408 RepID=A0A1U7NTH6_9DEIO|nr:hypothetical protein [Deinococcus marmoris]OLV16222.1 hypothetical protein BOO71_0012514 [Deinococcus marmoris]
MGEEPLTLCPDRTLACGVQGGFRRRPPPLPAIQESDIFLTRLLALPIRADAPPRVTFNELTTGYELETFMVHLA